MGKKDEIMRFTQMKIQALLRDDPWAKQQLASLRRYVGKTIEESPGTWEVLFTGIPDDLTAGGYDRTTQSEIAVFTAITLFALHQQSEDRPMNQRGQGFGKACNALAANPKTSSEAISRRFAAAITSQDVVELSNHARSLIKLMKSSEPPIALDYPRLAADIYDYQFESARSKVQKRWAMDYYKSNVFTQETKE